MLIVADALNLNGQTYQAITDISSSIVDASTRALQPSNITAAQPSTPSPEALPQIVEALSAMGLIL